MTNSPVSALPIAQLADVPDMNANAVALTNALDHIVIPKYASGSARDAANTSPIKNDMCAIGDDLFYRYNGAAWEPAGMNTRYAFRTATLTIATSKTTYCTLALVNPGTYRMSASVGINNTAGNALSAQIDFSGTATGSYSCILTNAAGVTTTAATIGITSFSSAQQSSNTAHMLWTFEGIIVVTVSGSITLAATAASSSKTADAGGYVRLEKWA